MTDGYEQRLAAALSRLTHGQREDFMERAGIIQYDGGLSRREAERSAYKIVTRKKQ